jgi:two-component system, NarL family, sensor kinase
MRMKHLLLMLLGFVFAMPLTAQQHLADSIETLLKKEMPDSTRAIAMVYRGRYYETIDSVKSKQFYLEAIEYATNKKLDYPLGFALHNSMFSDVSKGNKEEHAGDMEKAIFFLSRAKNSKAKVVLAMVMNDKASMFYKLGVYDSAATWYLKGIEVLEKEKKYDWAVGLYSNLASVYEILKLKDKQKEYTLKSLDAAKITGRDFDLFGAYSMVSQFYSGDDDYKKALLYADSARLYFTNKMSQTREHLYYLVRAQAFDGLTQYDSSVFYFNKAYDITKTNNDTWGMTEPLFRMGNAYMKLGRRKEAEEFLLKGVKLADENGVTVFKKSGYELLIKYYEETGNYQKALESYKKFYEANDSLQSADRKKIVLDLDKKYDTEKKEKQLVIQQATIAKKNTLNYVLIGSAATLLIISLLSYRTYTQKRKLQEQKITELEKEKLLSATQSLLKGKEDEGSRLAKDLHDGLGGLLSGVKLQLGAMKGNLILSEEHGRTFNNALGKLDESISEMRRVAHNMMPEALMKLGLQQALQDYCDGLSASQPFKINGEFYGLEKRMEPSTEIVVYRIVQELLNNAVKHSGADNILVQVMRHDNNLSITVEDNGKGFDEKEIETARGTGLKNIQSRVDYLKGQLDIKSTQGKGTSVHIDCIVDDNG